MTSTLHSPGSTGYDEAGLQKAIADEVTLEEFFACAPGINPHANARSRPSESRRPPRSPTSKPKSGCSSTPALSQRTAVQPP